MNGSDQPRGTTLSGYDVEMRLRFTTSDLDEAKEIVDLLERFHDYRALADVLFECDSALVNGNPIERAL
jgi:hypothetical protein